MKILVHISYMKVEFSVLLYEFIHAYFNKKTEFSELHILKYHYIFHI